MTKDSQLKTELYDYLKGYAEGFSAQSLEDYQGDFQLAGLKPIISTIINRSKDLDVHDIGCGNGIILKALFELNLINNYDVKYFGYDFEDNLESVYNYMIKNNLYGKVTAYSLTNWEKRIIKGKEKLFVCRNVFHELDIDLTTELIMSLIKSIEINDTILIQDMTTLNTAEKGNVGWIPRLLEDVLRTVGFETLSIPDTSKKGVEVYIIQARLLEFIDIEPETLKSDIILKRNEQLVLLKDKLVEIQVKFGNESIQYTRIIHDIIALEKQLGIKGDNYENTVNLMKCSILALVQSDTNALISKNKYEHISHFHNRGSQLQEFDNFNVDNDKKVLVVFGHKKTGKKALIQVGISKFFNERIPLIIECKNHIDSYRIIESIVSQLEITKYFDIELLKFLSTVSTEKMFEIFNNSYFKSVIVSKSVLILLNFENVIDKNNSVENKSILEFVNFWKSINNSKLVIDSDFKVTDFNNYECINCELGQMRGSSDSRFGSHIYIVQMLQNLVPPKYRVCGDDFGGFPKLLLDQIDHNPNIAFIFASKIKMSADVNCLMNPDFLELIASEVVDEIISQYNLCEDEIEAVYTLGLLSEEFDENLISKFTEYTKAINSLINKSIITIKFNKFYYISSIFNKIDRIEKYRNYSKADIKRKHERLAKLFIDLYKIYNKPQYIRQYMYHSLLCSEKKEFIAFYQTELLNYTEQAYKNRDYKGVLFVYNNITDNEVLSSKDQMRFASSNIRSGNIDKGISQFEKLFKKYKTWISCKHACVDSLLYYKTKYMYCKDLLETINENDRAAYWYKQMGKIHYYLNDYNKSIKCLQKAIELESNSTVVETGLFLLNIAKEIADYDLQKDCIEHLLQRKIEEVLEFKIELGTYYYKKGEYEQSTEILLSIFNNNTDNSYILLPLVKSMSELPESEKVKETIEKYTGEKNSIYKYAYTYIFRKAKDYASAEQCLNEIIRDDLENQHVWGQYAELFFDRYQNETIKNVQFLQNGLRFLDNILESNHVPSMLTCLEISKELGDAKVCERITNKISQINPRII